MTADTKQKLVMFLRKVKSTWSFIMCNDKIFLSNYISSESLRELCFKTIFCCIVWDKSYFMIDEIGRFCRLGLFSIPVKNIKILGFWASQNCNI